MANPYCFGRQLGAGVDGVVRICTDSSTGLQYACKSVNKSASDALLHIRTEIAMLEKLRGHPNIIAYQGHFEDDEQVHMAMDLCEGGDLCEHLQQKGPLTEREAARVMGVVVCAVMYCHGRGVMHRDLKPDNILFPRRNSSYGELKLADFGASADFSRRRVFTEVEGTPWYLAPEIFTGSYDEKVDVWSLGILLHIMLSGYVPFDGETTGDIFQAIKRGRLDLKKGPWPAISAEAKDLLKGMLQKNPYRRLRLTEILAHPWMQSSTGSGLERWGNMPASESVVVGG
ncbi:hypothetical protein GOP47_0001060 [Adiantum capillus-veneris]|uniref:Protein kinase domain-containing protein n=1 Tax=Adiantum capillus-veneris TaxID=13818 RepID=A0A9D4VFW7_ADICA|nr:hypothetical protein GOP47_0001060 [Adiantum capillus-veneris]